MLRSGRVDAKLQIPSGDVAASHGCIDNGSGPHEGLASGILKVVLRACARRWESCVSVVMMEKRRVRRKVQYAKE